MSSTTALSIKFRRTLLGCLVVQWLLVWVAVTLYTFFRPIRSAVESVFSEDSSTRLAIVGAISFALLVLAYLLRNVQIAKWLLLLLFSIGVAAIWVGMDVLLHSNARFFNCCFTLGWLILVTLLDGMPSSRRFNNNVVPNEVGGQGADSGSPQQPEEPRDLDYPRKYVDEWELLSIQWDGRIAFVVVGGISGVIFATTRLLSTLEFSLSLVFQFVSLGWMMLDLGRLDRALDFTEASNGVIFIYLDATILAWSIADMTTQCATLPLRVLGMELTKYYREVYPSGPTHLEFGESCSWDLWQCECFCHIPLFHDSKCLINSREHSCCPQCHEDDNYMVTDDTMRAHQHELRRRERALEKQRQGQEQINQEMERV